MYRRGVSKSRHKGPENRAFWHSAYWRSSRFRVLAIPQRKPDRGVFSQEKMRLHTAQNHPATGDSALESRLGRLFAQARHLAPEQVGIDPLASGQGPEARRPRTPSRPAITTMRSKLRKVERRCAMAITVRPPIRRSSACRTSSSDSLSSAEVASSSKRMGASLRNARAIPMRCRWPGDSFTPRSPTMVLVPSGRFAMNSAQLAAITASCTSASDASGRPYRMFSMIER